MCGIFAYLNYLTAVDRQSIADILTQGLKRLEYRGYDSAGKLLILSFTFTCRSLQSVFDNDDNDDKDKANELWWLYLFHSGHFPTTCGSTLRGSQRSRCQVKRKIVLEAVKRGQKKKTTQETIMRKQKARQCCLSYGNQRRLRNQTNRDDSLLSLVTLVFRSCYRWR